MEGEKEESPLESINAQEDSIISVSDGQETCASSGQQSSASSRGSSEGTLNEKSGALVCSGCKSELNPKFKFCFECGRKVQENITTSRLQIPEKSGTLVCSGCKRKGIEDIQDIPDIKRPKTETTVISAFSENESKLMNTAAQPIDQSFSPPNPIIFDATSESNEDNAQSSSGGSLHCKPIDKEENTDLEGEEMRQINQSVDAIPGQNERVFPEKENELLNTPALDEENQDYAGNNFKHEDTKAQRLQHQVALEEALEELDDIVSQTTAESYPKTKIETGKADNDNSDKQHANKDGKNIGGAKPKIKDKDEKPSGDGEKQNVEKEKKNDNDKGKQNVGKGKQNVGKGKQTVDQEKQNLEKERQIVGKEKQNFDNKKHTVGKAKQTVGKEKQNVGKEKQTDKEKRNVGGANGRESNKRVLETDYDGEKKVAKVEEKEQDGAFDQIPPRTPETGKKKKKGNVKKQPEKYVYDFSDINIV